MALKKYIGFEIECVYNSRLINLDVGGYHEGTQCGKFWTAQNDGSINPSRNNKNWADWGQCVEMVSVVLDSENKVKSAIKEFIDIMSKKGKYELNEVIDFNSSVGFHIHFSISRDGKEYRFKDFIDSGVFSKLRRRLFKDLKNSEIPSKTAIIQHYNRSYARQLRIDSLGHFRQSSDKYTEFNFYSEVKKQGLEWRSPNFLDIQTWSEFNYLVTLYLRYVKFITKKLIKSKTTKSEIIEIEYKEQPEIQEVLIKLDQPVNRG